MSSSGSVIDREACRSDCKRCVYLGEWNPREWKPDDDLEKPEEVERREKNPYGGASGEWPASMWAKKEKGK